MTPRKPKTKRRIGVMKKVRKPMAPPTRVEDDPKKYRREREKERLRRLKEAE